MSKRHSTQNELISINHVASVKINWLSVRRGKVPWPKNLYRAPVNLWEGNVFSLCLSVHGGVPMWPLPMMHGTSACRTPGPVPLWPETPWPQPPSPVQGPPIPSPTSQPLQRDPQPWHCMPLYMFKFVQVGLAIQGHLPAPQPGTFKLFHYE